MGKPADPGMSQPRYLLVLGKFSAERRRSLSAMATAAGLEMENQEGPAEALTWLDGHDPAGLLFEASVPRAEKVVAKLRAKRHLWHVPVLAMVSNPDDIWVQQHFAAGGDDLLALDSGSALLDRLRTIPHAAAPTGKAAVKAVVAESDRGRCDLLGRTLALAGYDVKYAGDMRSLEFFVTRYETDLVVASASLGDIREQHGKQRAAGTNSAWMVLAGRRELELQQAAFRGLERVQVLGAQLPPDQLLFCANGLVRGSGPEQRVARRIPFGTLVVFRSSGSDVDDLGFTGNLGQNGLFVRTLAAPVTRTIWLELRPPREKSRVRLEGRVAWRRSGEVSERFCPAPFGIGIELLDGLGDGLRQYESAVTALLGESGSSAKIPVVTEPEPVGSLSAEPSPVIAESPDKLDPLFSRPPRPAPKRALGGPPRPASSLVPRPGGSSPLAPEVTEPSPLPSPKTTSAAVRTDEPSTEPVDEGWGSASESERQAAEDLMLDLPTERPRAPEASEESPVEPLVIPPLDAFALEGGSPEAPEQLPAPPAALSVTEGAMTPVLPLAEPVIAATGPTLESAPAALASPRRNRAPLAWTLGLVLLLALIGTGLWAFLRPKTDTAVASPSDSVAASAAGAVASAPAVAPLAPPGPEPSAAVPDAGVVSDELAGYPPVDVEKGGTGRLLAKTYGFLLIRFPESAFVLANAVAIGVTNEKIATRCGRRELRVGVGERPFLWLSEPVTIDVACRSTTVAVVKRLPDVQVPEGTRRPSSQSINTGPGSPVEGAGQPRSESPSNDSAEQSGGVAAPGDPSTQR